jgi:hypothetical protein
LHHGTEGPKIDLKDGTEGPKIDLKDEDNKDNPEEGKDSSKSTDEILS